MRERESDELNDGEASLYTQRERSRTTQSARPVTTRVFGTVGIGCPGGSCHSDNLRTESRSNRFRDLEFVEIEGHPSSRLPICWNRVPTNFETSDSLESRSNGIQDLEFVEIGAAKVFEISNLLERVSDRADRDNDCVDGGRPSGEGRKVADRAERGKKNWTSLVAGYDPGGGGGGIQGRL